MSPRPSDWKAANASKAKVPERDLDLREREKMELIKVAIADANTLLREGLKRIFSAESDLLVVGEAEDEVEVAEVVERTKPDVLLLDLKIPKREAVPILLELKQKNIPTKVFILSLFPEKESILDTAKAGACGYALKRTSPATLVQAIRRVYRGEIWADRQLNCAETFAEFARQTQSCDANEQENDAAKLLSKREIEILGLVAKGLTNEEIRKTLFIALRTVKAHVNNVFHKLRVKNRTQAALRFVEAYKHESPEWKTIHVAPPPNPPPARRPGVLPISRPRRRANRLLRSGQSKHKAPSPTEKPEPH